MPAGIELAILGFKAGHVDRLAIWIVIYLHLKLLQYSEMTGHPWGYSGKNIKRQYNAIYQIDYGYICLL